MQDISRIMDNMTEHRLCDALPTMVWLSDHQAHLVYFNQECLSFTGSTSEQLKESGFVTSMHPDDVSVFQKMAVEALTTHKPSSCELRVRRYDGEYIWHHLRCCLCFEDKLWAGVTTNIHDKKLLEETARELEKTAREAEYEKSLVLDLIKTRMEFFAKMSHEIRTPIHGILGSVEITQELDLNTEQKKWVNIIKLSGQNLLTTINDILDFSKIESGKFDLFITDFEIRNVLFNVESVLLPMCSVKHIDLSIKCESNYPMWVNGDPDRLRQILLNFGSNAVKFTPEKGNISILVSLDGEITDKFVPTIIKIQDSGIGIPPNKINNLFNPFVQVDSSISKRYGGTGLGLAICKNLAELMNGTVGVTSETGKGSCFYLKVPLNISNIDPSKLVLIDDNQLRKDVASMKIVVLLAEDNLVNQMIAERNLAKYGIHVFVAADGVIALDKFKTIKYDAILMDCHMPNMDGFECAMEIRKYERNFKLDPIPIIACTASVMKEDVEKCRSCGMDEVCPKPFVTQDLVLMLKNFCKKN